MPVRYHPEVLDTLAGHGLAPSPHTPPAAVREALSDLYRYEIRALRSRLLEGRVARADYIGHVLDLRRKYWLLSVPVDRWTTC
jgi:hypothetical protein